MDQTKKIRKLIAALREELGPELNELPKTSQALDDLASSLKEPAKKSWEDVPLFNEY